MTLSLSPSFRACNIICCTTDLSKVVRASVPLVKRFVWRNLGGLVPKG